MTTIKENTPIGRACHPLFPTYGQIMPDRLYSTAEAAAILSVGTSTLRRWRTEGQGPTVTRLFQNAPPRYRGADLLQALDGAAEETAT